MRIRKLFGLGSALLLLVLALCLGGCSGGYQAADPLAGTAWIAQNDGSWWNFAVDGTFGWYQDKNVQDDNYYSGTYEAHRGQAGLDFLAESLTEFEHTRETAERMIEDNGKFDEDYILDNFICFSCNKQSFMMNGQEQLDGDWQTAYYGFLAEEDSQLVILNLRTGTWYWFDKEEA